MGRRPFPLAALVPEALRGVLLDFHWERERLWALDLPVAEVAVEELVWHLELPFWAVGETPFAVTPREVADDPERHAGQWERTLSADLAMPIHAVERDGRLVVLDGVHRLLKAVVEGRGTIAVKTLRPGDLDRIALVD
ncbi:MAG TPA: hypothetical protein VGF17_19690 [Phytomonospora sp.]